MLTKCICTNCAGHLEFEEENAGESIPCPHCGFKTILAVPGTEAPDPELLSMLRKQALRRRLLRLTAPVLVLAGFAFVLYHWGAPWLQEFQPAIDSTTKAVLVLLLFCLMLPFAIVWLIFPVLLFFQLRKLLHVLDQIAQSSQPEQSDPTPVEEEPLSIQSD